MTDWASRCTTHHACDCISEQLRKARAQLDAVRRCEGELGRRLHELRNADEFSVYAAGFKEAFYELSDALAAGVTKEGQR